MKRKTKTETYLETANGRESDVRIEGDFSPAQRLSDLIERLHIFESELQNISAWIQEEFGNPINEKTKLRLDQAIRELQKLIRLATR